MDQNILWNRIIDGFLPGMVRSVWSYGDLLKNTPKSNPIPFLKFCNGP